MTLSLCMIVKDEEQVLERCLKDIANLFDEIIIVDTGSTDNTVDIAKKFTDKVYFFEWVQDFSKARNYSFSKATSDYIMWLDADDVIVESEIEKLKNLKEKLNGEVDCYYLKYAISFDDNNNPTFAYLRERIIKNDGTFFWSDPVHEAITPHGKIEYCDITIYHKKIKSTPSDRNLKIYENLIKQKKELTPRQKFYYSRELFYNAKYYDAIKSFEEYLQYYNGWKENKIEACLTLAKCYLLLNDNKNAINALINSFNYDTPRAEILCELGNILISEKRFNESIYWLNLAKKCKPNFQSGAFILLECYNLIPNLLLTVAHYQLGNVSKAKYYNSLCEKINPNHPSVIFNKQFFKLMKNKKAG